MAKRTTLTETPADKAARAALSKESVFADLSDNPIIAFFQVIGNILSALFDAIKSAATNLSNDDSEMPEGQKPAGRVPFTIAQAEQMIGTLKYNPRLIELANKYRSGVPEAISPFAVAAKITSHFGEREAPRNQAGVIVGSRDHKGIDMIPSTYGPQSSFIHATMPGVIVRSETQRDESGKMAGYGHWIEIAGFDGKRYRYAHLAQPGPARGTVVDQGEQIGIMGATGHGTGAHLHYEVRGTNDVALAPVIQGRTFGRNDRSYVGQIVAPAESSRYASSGKSVADQGPIAPTAFRNSRVAAGAAVARN